MNNLSQSTHCPTVSDKKSTLFPSDEDQEGDKYLHDLLVNHRLIRSLTIYIFDPGIHYNL
jgi:hypothetical protein